MSLDSKERVYCIHVIYLKLQVHWGKGIVSCSVSSVVSALFNVEMQFIYHLTLEKGLLRSIFTFWSFDIKRVYFVPRASRDAPISSTSSSSKSKFIVKYTRKAHANISRRIRLLKTSTSSIHLWTLYLDVEVCLNAKRWSSQPRTDLRWNQSER